MALRTLSEIRARLARYTGMDTDDSDNSTIIDDFVSETYQDIIRREEWRFLMKEGLIYSVAPLSDGTITTVSTAVTGVGTAFAASHVGQYLQIDALGDEAHLISAVGSATTLTLATEPSADSAASDYLLYQSDYGLADGVDEHTLKYLVDTNDSRRIPVIPLQQAEDLYPNQGGLVVSDTVDFACFVGRNANNVPVLRLFPVPNEVRAFKYVASDDVDDMTLGTQTPFLPERFKNVIEEGAKARIYNWLGKFDRAQLHEAKYESIIKDMKRAERTLALHVYPAMPNDLRGKSRTLQGLRLPPNFGDDRF